MPGVTTTSGSRAPGVTRVVACTDVCLAAIAMTGAKLRAVLLNTRFPCQSATWALMSARSAVRPYSRTWDRPEKSRTSLPSGDARSASTDTLCESALRDEFKLDLASAIQVGEYGGVRAPRIRTDHLVDLAVLNERGQSYLAAAGVVVDDRQTTGTVVDQGVDEFDRAPSLTEPADHHGGTIGNGRDRLDRAGRPLVDHLGA